MNFFNINLRASTVVILCGPAHRIRSFLLLAHRMGMSNGEFVFVNPSLHGALLSLLSAFSFTQDFTAPWKLGLPDDDEAMLAYRPLIMVFSILSKVLSGCTKHLKQNIRTIVLMHFKI